MSPAAVKAIAIGFTPDSKHLIVRGATTSGIGLYALSDFAKADQLPVSVSIESVVGGQGVDGFALAPAQ